MDGRQFKNSIFQEIERVAAALASAKRLEIIDVLSQGERSVDAIAHETDTSIANTSRHLQALRGAGLVRSRRQGQRVIYTIAGPDVVRTYQAIRTLAASVLLEIPRLADDFFADRDGLEPMTMPELSARIDAGDVVVIDVRPPSEFNAGHIAGAVNVPLPDLAARMSEIPAAVPVVAYCRGPYCVLAVEAVHELRLAGRDATRLDVGYPEWRSTGRPTKAG